MFEEMSIDKACGWMKRYLRVLKRLLWGLVLGDMVT